jgi:predicted Zn-dependent protease
MNLHSNIFEGQLYDGKSSNPIPVAVILYSDKLVIHPKETEKNHPTQTWENSKLKDYQKLSIDLVQIRYGDFPSQTLEVKSTLFAENFKPPKSGLTRLVHKLTHSGWITLTTIILFALGALLFLYMYALPWLSEQAVRFVPMEYEVKMGEELYENLMKEEKIDSARTKLANLFIKEIDFQTEYPLQVTVVESEIKNAFALPGGHIVIYSKLLNDMRQYEELCGLLGHEVGHVKLRHTTKNIFRGLSGYLLISVFLGDFSGVSATLLDNAHQLNQLSYSRALETEADEASLACMQHNKIKPEGILSLFNNLEKGHNDNLNIPEFFSTHPVTENRKQHIKEKTAKAKNLYIEHAFLEGLFQQMQKN